MTADARRTIVIDIDGTLTIPEEGVPYDALQPNLAVVEALRRYQKEGVKIALSTSRNMRAYENNIGAIVANTIPVLLEWLKRHDIPFDEIWPGKPWCGPGGFYVDDRAIRPDEFVAMSDSEIRGLLGDA